MYKVRTEGCSKKECHSEFISESVLYLNHLDPETSSG
jgi:hypothetical protein